MTGAIRSAAGLFGWRPTRTKKSSTPRLSRPLPSTRWDNVGLAVEQSFALFLPIAESVPGVVRVDAKTSGPTVHFLITTAAPWHEAIESIEAKLFALAKAGQLPPLDYDVQEEDEAVSSPQPGYLQVFPA